MDLNIKMEKNCFCCLRNTDCLVDISENGEIQAQFWKTFHFEIEIKKDTSKYMCELCRNKLNAATEFLNQVRNCVKYLNDNIILQEGFFQVQVKAEGDPLENLEENEVSEHHVEDSEKECRNNNNPNEDSDNEPLAIYVKKICKKKKGKLKKIPLEEIEAALEEYNSIRREKSKCILCSWRGKSLLNHMIYKHREASKMYCSKCNILFDNKEEHHKSKEHKNRVYCKFCNKEVSQCHYRGHLRTHAGLVYPCEECEKKFISQNALDEHVNLQHKDEKPYDCPHCPRSFKLLHRLETHMALHGRYSCQSCKKNFEILHLMESHICEADNPDNETVSSLEDDNTQETESFSDTAPEENILDNIENKISNPCIEVQDQRGIVSDSKLLQEQDKEQATQISEDTVEKYEQTNSNLHIKQVEHLGCHLCGNTYKSSWKLQKHIDGHMGIFNIYCQYCGKGFNSKTDLKIHERKHTKEKPFVCSECGKAFKTAGTLKTHSIQHEGKPEECEICQKRFCRKAELKLHLQKHRGERPFLCNDCGKTFAQKSHLINHEAVHTKVRPYVCSICNKAFKTKGVYKLHVKYHGAKQLECKLCTYECHSKFRLRQHMKQHEENGTNSKVFCKLCKKMFCSVTSLQSHMRSAHMVV